MSQVCESRSGCRSHSLVPSTIWRAAARTGCAACELPLHQGAATAEEKEGADRGEMATTPLRARSKHVTWQGPDPCLKATPTWRRLLDDTVAWNTGETGGSGVYVCSTTCWVADLARTGLFCAVWCFMASLKIHKGPLTAALILSVCVHFSACVMADLNEWPTGCQRGRHGIASFACIID